MAEASATKGTHEVVLNVNGKSNNNEDSCVCLLVPFLQKLVAEFVGTFFLMFAGEASEVVDVGYGNKITLTGIAVVWGLAVLVLVYAVSHISGAHFNPAVTLAFASTGRFPLIQVPAYISVQILASILASGTLRLIFTGTHDHFAGTLLSGTHLQGFVVEFIITFYIMLVKYSTSGVATDNKTMSQVAGLAVGSTMLLNVMFAG
ncbi:nodulin-26-like [Neltuma alba]|nr:nodulin-26-like [Prosopis alba]